MAAASFTGEVALFIGGIEIRGFAPGYVIRPDSARRRLARVARARLREARQRYGRRESIAEIAAAVKWTPGSVRVACAGTLWVFGVPIIGRGR